MSFLLAITLLVSCKKETDGSAEIDPGAMQGSSIAPTEAPGGTVLTLKGSGLGAIRSIVFDKNNVPAPFTPTLNTDNAVVFRVPDTAFGGNQNVIFTNKEGRTLSMPFKVIALPTVSTAFPTDFEAGTVINLTGNNLDDVTTVVLEGTSDAAIIVSKSRKEMVIKMPTSNVNRAKLQITNSSGVRVTDIEFVNVPKAFGIFKDDLGAGIDNWSWGGTYTPSAENSITGAKGLKAEYDAGGAWGGLYLHPSTPISLAGYSFLSFWVKGADVDKQVTLNINWSKQKVYTIPANKWTYIKEPITPFLAGVNTITDFVLQMHEAGKTVYYDNILLVQ